MEFDPHDAEDRDGVRFSWNAWPSTRTEAGKVVVPLGCIYTPLHRGPNLPVVEYEPIMCKGPCRTILNPFCDVDFVGKSWACPFCYMRNQFPPHYAQVSETTLPAELIPAFSTMEYQLQRTAALPPVFLFVVDTCLRDDQLQPLKESLLVAMGLLPSTAIVGLITFGSTVQVHELSFELCPKSYVFNGAKDIDPKQVQQLLGFGGPTAAGGAPGQQGARGNPRAAAAAAAAGGASGDRRFLLPLGECDLTLETIIGELQADPRPAKAESRPLRCTGVALSVAIGLLGCTFPNSAARLVLVVGGPCTHGPGMVVSPDLKETLRSHHDLQRDQAKHTSSATKYYSKLAQQAVQNGHAVDIMVGSLDQVGAYEMRDLVRQTGGLISMADLFDSEMFQESFKKLFDQDQSGKLKMGFNAGIEVQTSKELKICGAIGHCTSLNKKGPSVSETEIGVGGTSAWKICSLDPTASVAFYFDVVNQPTTPVGRGHRGVLQFLTQYQNSMGQRILRVTTIARPWADPAQGNYALAQGFDQEAATVLMARIAVFKAESSDAGDVLRWIDRMLIRLCNKFAEFRKDDPSSFRLSPNFTLYPQFMFHLRRSQVLQVFNNSPDETAFRRMLMNRETVGNALLMIQPTLEAYMFNQFGVPVLLSATSLAPDRILVLDTFFSLVVWVGDNVADWRKGGYHLKPEYAHVKQLLDAPAEFVASVKRERFPAPRYVECDQGTSQARFVSSIVDPSVTHMSMNQAGGEAVLTEDVNLEVFMEHLKKLAVQS